MLRMLLWGPRRPCFIRPSVRSCSEYGPKILLVAELSQAPCTADIGRSSPIAILLVYDLVSWQRRSVFVGSLSSFRGLRLLSSVHANASLKRREGLEE